MIHYCKDEDLPQMLELAFEKNKHKESQSCFCHSEKESIQKDFSQAINNKNYLVLGDFENNKLSALLLCFLQEKRNHADCIGPFIADDKNYIEMAHSLLSFAQKEKPDFSYGFYFPKENKQCRDFLESISAKRNENEYFLNLIKKDFIALPRTDSITLLSKEYEDNFCALHKSVFPDIYLLAEDILLDDKRNVFTFIEEGQIFAYSVLKLEKFMATAEIIAVAEKSRGKGYGKKILNHLLIEAFQYPTIENVRLVVDLDNERALSLYQSFGFQIEQENYSYMV